MSPLSFVPATSRKTTARTSQCASSAMCPSVLLRRAWDETATGTSHVGGRWGRFMGCVNFHEDCHDVCLHSPPGARTWWKSIKTNHLLLSCHVLARMTFIFLTLRSQHQVIHPKLWHWVCCEWYHFFPWQTTSEDVLRTVEWLGERAPGLETPWRASTCWSLGMLYHLEWQVMNDQLDSW